jgi:hypothetical protein
MLLCLSSVKGSPGVTTTALAVAARWPASWRRVLVEADPAGGDLAARYGLALTPGLASLAAAARDTTDPELVWEHAQQLPGGLAVVAGPTRADQAHAALAAICGADGRAGLLGGFTGRGDVVAIVDCGRLDPDTPLGGVVAAADQLLLLARPHADELAHLAARATELVAGRARTRLLLIGAGYPPNEVAREVGMGVLAHLPHDPRTAAALCGHATRHARQRARLARAATRIAAELAIDPRRLAPTAVSLDDSAGQGTDPRERRAAPRAASSNGYRS